MTSSHAAPAVAALAAFFLAAGPASHDRRPALPAASSVLQDPAVRAAAPAAPTAPAARPADVASVDAIVSALYDVISGPAGAARDWDRFRSLFDASAELVACARRPDGTSQSATMTPDDYVARSGPRLEQRGFAEREIARREEGYGDVAHAFSTYEGRFGDAEAPAVRGVNSIQLVRRDGRWWIRSLAWQQEAAQLPLPERYLPKSGDDR